MKIPDDKNAQDALLAVDRIISKEMGISLGFPSEEAKRWIKSERESRVRHILEEGEFKAAKQSGKFVCVEGYVFKNIVEDAKTYKIYRCDGGHHFAIVFKEFKDRKGSNENEIKLVLRNGQLVPESSTEKNDRLELE